MKAGFCLLILEGQKQKQLFSTCFKWPSNQPVNFYQIRVCHKGVISWIFAIRTPWYLHFLWLTLADVFWLFVIVLDWKISCILIGCQKVVENSFDRRTIPALFRNPPSWRQRHRYLAAFIYTRTLRSPMTKHISCDSGDHGGQLWFSKYLLIFNLWRYRTGRTPCTPELLEKL